MTQNTEVFFHLPTKPYGVIAAINRIAAATGSVRNAQLSAYADYNGHFLRANYNEFRRYYICEHFYGERVVHARGDVEHVIKTAVQVYKSQGLGGSLTVSVRAEDVQKVRDLNLLVEGQLPDIKDCEWYTWRHREVANALWMEKHIGISATHALLCAHDIDDYNFLVRGRNTEELLKRTILPEVLEAEKKLNEQFRQERIGR